MKASDAKKLVAEFEAKKKLVPLYEKIKEAASLGHGFLVVTPPEVDDHAREVLEKNGFAVFDEREEIGPHDRSKLVRWRIHWDLTIKRN